MIRNAKHEGRVHIEHRTHEGIHLQEGEDIHPRNQQDEVEKEIHSVINMIHIACHY